MRIYSLSLKIIILLASVPHGLCDSIKKTHGVGLRNHLRLQLTEAQIPGNSPPYCTYPTPPSRAAPLPFSSTPPPPYPTPPHYAPEPPVIITPPIFHPLPPPTPHNGKPENAVWCVAKPTVPEVLLQQAMDYACGSGAGCEAIQLNGMCFQPDTILSHASYAFNSYWQKTKQAGGTCEFGGTAMLVTVDPSYDQCNFVYF